MLIISPKVGRFLVLLFQFSTGVILAIFMFILYLVACLSFVMIAVAVSAVFLAARMISSEKIDVSFDEEGDTSYLKAVWGS